MLLTVSAFDRDPARLILFELRQRDFEYAVFALRLDMFSVRAVRQAEPPVKGTAYAFYARVPFMRLFLLAGALTLDGQDTPSMVISISLGSTPGISARIT